MKKLGILLVACLLATLVFDAVACGGGGGGAPATPIQTVQPTTTEVVTLTPGQTAATVTLVPAEELQKFLPEAPAGFSQEDYQCRSGGRIFTSQGHITDTVNFVSCPYQSENGQVGIEIADSGGQLYLMTKPPAYWREYQGFGDYGQKNTVHGYPGYRTGSPGDTSLNILAHYSQFVDIGNRFEVIIGSSAEKISEAEANVAKFMDLIDYDGIAALH